MSNIIPIDILAHADFAGCLRQNKRNPGLVAYCDAIDSVRDKNLEGTLLLDSGDQFCNIYWGGQPMVEALNLIKTDVMTLGNHEFDNSKDFIEECVTYAKFPMLCANIIEEATQTFVKGVLPYVVVEKRGVKIGVLGLTTEYTPYMVKRGAFDPYRVLSSIETANYYIPKIKEEGAEIVVVLSHFPFYIDEDRSISGELYDVMREIPKVDVFVGGHINGDYAQEVDGTVVLKAGFGGQSLAHTRLWFNLDRRQVVKSESDIILTDRNAKGKKEIKDYVDLVTGPFEDFFNEVLAVADEKWTMKYATETKLGNFLADILLDGGNAEISYMNTTSAGGSIYPGEIKVEDLTSIYGFNDEILTTYMPGDYLYRLIEHIYRPERFGNNATIAFSGIIVHIDHNQKSPNKLQSITLRDGTPLERDKIYKVASSEYMALGGNDTYDIVGDLDWKHSGLLYYDAMFSYLRKYKTLLRYTEKRLHEIGFPENDNSPD